MIAFFEATWFLWWLFAAVVAVWSAQRFSHEDEGGPSNQPSWRTLYQQALVQRDTENAGIRIGEAETAILRELSAQVFERNSTESLALHEAMNNLRALRESDS